MVHPMKWTSLLIIAAILFSVAVPAVTVYSGTGPTTVGIQTLDVCHNHINGANPDLPCIIACPCRFLPSTSVAVAAFPNPLSKPFFIAFQDEQPPKN